MRGSCITKIVMKITRTALLLCLLLAACSPSRKKQIIGLWQEVKVINPQLDSAIFVQRIFMDTVGREMDSMAIQSHYHTDNIDTFKANMNAQLTEYLRAQTHAINATWFEFHRDGLVYLHSDTGLDSAKYYFDDDGALMLDEAALKGGGSKLRMEVLMLNDTGLQLKYTEQYLNSTAVLKRVVR